MQVGLFFGSFNPIHHGHLIVGSWCATQESLDEVWFVVSPQNPVKRAGTLLNERHRLSLVQLAVEADKNLKASAIEFKLPRPSYTVDTLRHLTDQYPQHSFTLIVGSDSFQNLPNWKNGEYIINNYNIIVYVRPGFPVPQRLPTGARVVAAPLLDLSATLIRKQIRAGKSIRYLVPEPVREEIEAQGFYAERSENPT